jgi:uncharacterized protein (TIGR03067 family)
MKRLLICAWLLPALGTVAWADAPTAEDELKKFAGAWKITAWISDGQTVAPEDYKEIRRTVTGNRAVWRAGDNVFLEMQLNIDASQSPKTLDSTILTGDQRGKALRSIYEFTSENEMRAATALVDKPRPTEFKSTPGSGIMLFTFERVSDNP